MAKAIEGLYEKYLQLYGKKERWRLGGSFGDALKAGNIDDAMAHADDTNKQRLKLIVNNYYQYGETYKDFLLGESYDDDKRTRLPVINRTRYEDKRRQEEMKESVSSSAAPESKVS